jgi:hypothetical protein
LYRERDFSDNGKSRIFAKIGEGHRPDNKPKAPSLRKWRLLNSTPFVLIRLFTEHIPAFFIIENRKPKKIQALLPKILEHLMKMRKVDNIQSTKPSCYSLILAKRVPREIVIIKQLEKGQIIHYFNGMKRNAKSVMVFHEQKIRK